jgi:hypothetical protein
MKYLRKFNEGVSAEDIRDFCESTLAYLMDEGFTIKIFSSDDPHTSLPKGQFNIWLQKDNAKSFFKWDDVKDYYIPFLQLLSNRYDIGGMKEVSNWGGYSTSSTDGEKSIRFRYRQKKDYSFVNVNKDFSYARVINDDVFDSEGYWKDQIYYKWIPDPDLIGIGVNIKSNQIKLEI